MSQLKQFLHSERLEIKPSLGDGHCLLYSVCASYNNQLSQLLPLNKEDLINIIEKELQDHSELYLGFYTKSRKEFFSELSNYIKHKRYNSDICDIIPIVIANALKLKLKILNEKRHKSSSQKTYIKHKRYNSDICDIIPIVIANALKLKLKILNEKRHDTFETTIVEPFSASHTGVLFIHRKGDHYNGVVYRIYSRTVQSALHPPSARRVSCSTGTTLAPRPTRVRPSSSSARADPTHCPSRVRPPSSSTRADPAHCPTRAGPLSSSTRAYPAHCPTRAGPTRADIPSSSARADPAHCPTRVRHPSSSTRADQRIALHVLALHVLALHPVLQGRPSTLPYTCSSSLQFYKGRPSTFPYTCWPYTCLPFIQFCKGRPSTLPYTCSPSIQFYKGRPSTFPYTC